MLQGTKNLEYLRDYKGNTAFSTCHSLFQPQSSAVWKVIPRTASSSSFSFIWKIVAVHAAGGNAGSIPCARTGLRFKSLAFAAANSLFIDAASSLKSFIISVISCLSIVPLPSLSIFSNNFCRFFLRPIIYFCGRLNPV